MDKLGRKTVYNEVFSEEIWQKVNPENKALLDDFVAYKKSSDKSAQTILQYYQMIRLFFCWNYEYNGDKFFVDMRKREFVKFFGHCVETFGWSPARTATVKSALSSMSNYIENVLDGGMDGATLKSPKSYSGYRKIPICSELYEKLVSCAKENRICNMTASAVSSSWGKFREKHNINKCCNFHALRHHFASQCLLMGMPQKYIAELMGHNSLDMIEKVYQHVFPSAMEKFANNIREQNSKFYER